MKFSTLSIAIAMLFASAVSAAELSYTPRTVAGSRTIEYMDISATEGGSPIWDLTIILSVSDGHTYWLPGDITSFVDAQHGGGFDYSPEVAGVQNRGVFVSSKVDLIKTFATTITEQSASKFTMALTGVSSGFDVVQTISINAPAVAGGGYVSTVDHTTVSTNNTAGSLNNSGWGVTNESGIQLNGDGNAIALDNPVNGKVKGDPHAINHPYYDCTSWFGGDGTTGPVADGALAIATVSSGLASMRQGLEFKYESNQDLTYTDLANSLRGALAEAPAIYGSPLKLTSGNALREPTGRDGIGRDIGAGQSFTIAATGTITAPVPEPATFGLLAIGSVLIAARRR